MLEDAEILDENHLKEFQALFGPKYPETLNSCIKQAKLLLEQQRY
jgi:hypothetical protein